MTPEQRKELERVRQFVMLEIKRDIVSRSMSPTMETLSRIDWCLKNDPPVDHHWLRTSIEVGREIARSFEVHMKYDNHATAQVGDRVRPISTPQIMALVVDIDYERRSINVEFSTGEADVWQHPIQYQLVKRGK